MKYLLLLSLCSITSMCAQYESSVDSRSVGVQASAANGGSGKLVYTVHYR